MKQVTKVIPLPPFTGNHQHGQAGRRRYLKPEMQAWQITVGAIFGGAKIKGENYRLKVDLVFGDNRRRDISNYIKVVEDALVKAKVIKDDSLIVELSGTKTVADDPKMAMATITVIGI